MKLLVEEIRYGDGLSEMILVLEKRERFKLSFSEKEKLGFPMSCQIGWRISS